MVQDVVSSVVNKLSDLLIQEAVFLDGVGHQIELVKLQLHQMECFLKDADSKQKKDERVKGWVKDIRDVAYETEDAIDTFVGGIAPSKMKGISVFKKFARKPSELYSQHKLGIEISKVQTKLKIISEGRITFGIENLGDERSEVVPVAKRAVNLDNDDYEIVGFKDEKRKLIDQLVVSGSRQRRRVVSIVGQGGLGKTTLAQKIYNATEIKMHFDVTVWLTISNDFKIVDILKNGLRKLGVVVSKEMQNDEEFLLEEMRKTLGERRYLIVLDDVWARDFFALFVRALPDVGNGSRLLMTSRFLAVAKRADPGSMPHELRYLDEEESLKLLLSKAFPYQNPASTCFTSNDLAEVAKPLAKKCGGLPLALVVAGGLLSVRDPTYDAWNRIMQTMDWRSDGSECMQVLATSYQDLQYPLKECFLYLACFPEDYEIHAGPLMRMWIAEGFIKPEGRWTMEDAAERYLEELTQRCMVQVSRRSLKYGTIERCRVHDLFRELAINESKENNFVELNPKPNEKQHPALRRAAHFQTDVVKFCKYTNFRSLLIFNIRIPSLIRFRLLRVLELKGVLITENNPTEVTHMVHLRYLGLNGTWIPSLPENIDRLQKLETLDIRDTFVTTVPVSLWEIKTLRHVHASWKRPINGPPRGFKLDHLMSLKYVKVMRWEKGLPHMKNVRKLKLVNKDNILDSEPTTQLLKNLEHLCSLSVEWQVLPEDIVDMRSYRSYNNIRNLGLLGEWPQRMHLNVAMLPVHLTHLMLYRTRFEQDPMPELKKLPSMKVLDLGQHAIACKKIVCSAGGFRQLERMHLTENDSLEEWSVQEGSLPVLKYLWIVACWKLRTLPDLHNVTSLQEFEMSVMPHEFKLRIAHPGGEDCHKIKHIPAVLYIF